MNKLEKLKSYQEILRKDEPVDTFNLWAFIFNSFYYLWKDLGLLLFAVYAFATPLLFVIMLLIKIEPQIALTAAILLVRTTAGLRANIDIRNHMERFVAKYKDFKPEKEEPVVYFSVSLLRLFLASLFSFGLYDVYWAYKNWEAVRNYKKDDSIYPFFRSWFFGIFYIYPLFSQIKQSCTSTKPVRSLFGLCSVVYTILYMIKILLIRLSDKTADEEVSIGLFLFSMIVTLLSALFLLPIQKAVNEHNHKLNPEQRPLNFFYPGELAVIIIPLTAVTFFALNGYWEN